MIKWCLEDFTMMNMEDLGHWKCLQAFPNVKLNENIRVIFIENSNVLPSHVDVLDHKQRARAQGRMRSIVGMALDREMYTWSHVTALNSHGPGNEAMAVRAMRDMWLTRHALDRASWARAQCARSHQECARSHWQRPRFHLCSIPPL